MGHWRGQLVLVLLVLLVMLVVGATAPTWAEHLPVRRYTVADGLPSDRINDLYTDTLGYLWIATGDGLSRYDGYGFVNYDERDGLPGPIVLSILQTHDGAFWVGTSEALCRFDPRPAPQPGGARAPRFVCRAVGEDGSRRSAGTLLEGHDGTLWIGSEDGLFLLERAGEPGAGITRAAVAQPLPLPKRDVNALAEDPQGGLWVGTRQGLVHRLPSGEMIPFAPFREGTDPSVFDLLFDPPGRLWVATNRTLFSIELPLRGDLEHGKELVLENLALEPSATGVREHGRLDRSPIYRGHLALDSDGAVMLLAKDLCRVEHEDLRCASVEKIAPDEVRLRQVAMDRFGGLWLGTESSGLVHLASRNLTSYGRDDGLPSTRIRSIFEAPFDGLHVLTEQDLARWTGTRFVPVRARIPKTIHSMGWGWNQILLQDHTAEWWIATAEGLLRYPRVARTEDLSRATPKHIYTTRDGLSGDDIFRVYEDRRGDVWIGSFGSGADFLNRWDRLTDRIHTWPLPGRYRWNAPTTFAEDRSGHLWIGFLNGGLARRSGDRFDLYPPGEALPEGRVSDLLVDGSGRLWIATTGAGVGVIEKPEAPNPSFAWFTRKDGLSSNRVYCVAEDGLGRIYLGTTRGVDRLDPVTRRVLHYSVADGLPTAEVELARRDRLGDLWFGTLDGLARLHPQPDAPEPEPPVLINLVRVDGVDEPVSDLGEAEIGGLVVGPGSRRLEIGFLALALPRGGDLRYEYRLRGASDAWSPPAPDRFVNFSSLSPGSYRFEVSAVTPAGMRSTRPASVSFTLRPPFWRTWWFDFMTTGVVAASALALHRRRAAHLVELERMRIRIATDLHDEVGAGLSEIALMSELWSRRGAPDASPDGIPERIAAKSRRLVDAMSNIVWAINPDRDLVSSLSQRMRRFATTLLRAAGITLRFQTIGEAEDRALDGDARRELLLAFQEILNNAVKHARCSTVDVRLAADGLHLVMEVTDDGRGFDPAVAEEGTGLSSLKLRASRLGGTCEIRSEPASGTCVRFRIPLRRWRGRTTSASLPDRGGPGGSA